MTDVESGKEITTITVGADLAGFSRIRVQEVDSPAITSDVVRQVLRACAIDRVEEGIFTFVADHLGIPDAKGQHARDDVVEGIEVVHPESPEDIELLVWDEDTTEEYQDTDDEGVHEGGEGRVRRVGGDELTNTGVDQLVDQHDEESGSRSVRVVGESPHGPVPAGEVENGADTEVGEFRDDETGDEGDPGIHLGLLFASVVDIAALDEQRLELVDDTGGDEDEVEDREHFQIQRGYTGTGAPEGETVEQG